MTRGSTKSAALLAGLLGLLPGGSPLRAQSAPPDLLTYQGTLADSAGTPLTGNFAMAFRFFDAGVGGTLLLTDTHAAVGATEGLYTVLLGSGTVAAGAEAALSGVFRNRAAVFLEVEISGQTLSPRVRITAQGYALNAGSLEGRPASDFIDTASATQTIGGDLTVTGSITVPGGITGLPAPAAASDAATRDYVDTSVAAVTGNFIQNQVVADQAAGFRITGNGLFNGGSVGIGTTGPTEALTIATGHILVQNAGMQSLVMKLNNTNATGREWWVNSFNDGSFRLSNNGVNGAGPVTHPFIVDSTGRVGIGTSAPLGRLDVVSTSGASFFRSQDTGVQVAFRTASSTSPNLFSDLLLQRARGDLLAMADVAAGDVLGRIQFSGRAGGSFEAAAQIQVDAVAAPGAGSMPGDLRIFTTPNGSITPVERMRIEAGGDVGIGTDIPGSLLHVVSTTASMTFPATPGGNVGILLESPVAGHAPVLTLNNTSGTGKSYRLASFGDGVNRTGFRIMDETAFLDRFVIDTGGSIGINTSTEFGSGDGVVGLANATTAPTVNPVGGGILYATGGALHWLGSGGTDTTIAPAEPHCPVCGADFMLEWSNPKYGYLAVCVRCLARELGSPGWILREKSEATRTDATFVDPRTDRPENAGVVRRLEARVRELETKAARVDDLEARLEALERGVK